MSKYKIIIPHNIKYLPFTTRYKSKQFNKELIGNLGELYRVAEDIYINQPYLLSVKHKLLFYYLVEQISKEYAKHKYELEDADIDIKISYKDIARFIGYHSLHMDVKQSTTSNRKLKV